MAETPSPERNKRPPSLFAVFGIAFIIGVLFLQFCRTDISNRDTSTSAITEYSSLITQLEKDNIKQIAIYDNGDVQGEFFDIVNGSTRFTTHVNKEILKDFIKRLEERKVPMIHPYPQSSPWAALFRWIPILLMVGFFIFFMQRMQGGGNAAMSFGKSKAKLISKDNKKVTFKDVAGIEEAKEELQEIIEFLKTPDKFTRLGGRIPKGVLLMGAPGTGKTLLARAVAGEASVPFFSISGSDFVEMFVGVGASRVRDLFEQGKKNAPCIVFIDEIDAVGRHRGAGLGGGHDEREQTLNQLLVEMDGFEANEGVILISATNRPDVLDPALLRPGRFDRRIVIDRPDVKGRFGILEVHTKKIPLSDDVDLNVIARGTPGSVGADLANLVIEAALNAAGLNREKVFMDNFEFAKDKVLMGKERRSMIISDEEKQITAVHEAGHAILAVVTPEADPLHKVTIIPRGMSLGLTQMLPEEDRHNVSKSHLEAQIRVLLGGRCAEEEVLKEQTTGADNDLERATDIVDKMVRRWGMSKVGLLQYAKEEGNVFLGMQLAQKQRECSEATAKRIDEEKERLISEAYKAVKTTLNERRKALDEVAERLLTEETISGDVVREIVKANEPS